ncbi:transcription factor ATOH8 [Lissotriton helveticus]
MRNLQVMEDAAAWGSLVKEVNGFKKLKRKNKEAMKQLHGLKRCRATLKCSPPSERPSTSDEDTPQLRAVADGARTDAASAALDLRNGAFSSAAGVPSRPAGVPSRPAGCLPAPRREPFLSPAALHGFEPRGFAEQQQQALQSRIVFCPQRPLEGSFAPASHAQHQHHQGMYSPPSPDSSSSISPRRGGGDAAAGPPGEVRAIQQTRRLLANARERTRVHTISAAFEALRKQVPCYSYGQKLSKLAILRIACNYILSLAKLADLDYTVDHSSMSFAECVEQCTRTLQAEGRSKKRKE